MITKIRSIREKPAAFTLPPELYTMILLFAYWSDPAIRTRLQFTCRFFRALALLNGSLWTEMTTLPSTATRFLDYLFLVRYHRSTVTILLDDSNCGEDLPSPPLLLSTIAHCKSLLIRHHIPVLDAIRELDALRQAPLLTALEIAPSGGIRPRDRNIANDLEEEYPDKMPTLYAPNLDYLWLMHCYISLPLSTKITTICIDCHDARVDTPSFNGWYPRMLLNQIARCRDLVSLHLTEPIRLSGVRDYSFAVTLPALEEFHLYTSFVLVALWACNCIDFPVTTYIGINVGTRCDADINPCEAIAEVLGT